jgi:thioredoxin 1
MIRARCAERVEKQFVTSCLFAALVVQRRMKTIAELNAETFDATLAKAATPVVVDFYAPWCGPCKMLAPMLETLAGQFDGRAEFFKVNVDDAPELAVRYQITGVPTLMIFDRGQMCDTIVGLPSPRALVSKLEDLAKAAESNPEKGKCACCH